jgi:hypothetical protein
MTMKFHCEGSFRSKVVLQTDGRLGTIDRSQMYDIDGFDYTSLYIEVTIEYSNMYQAIRWHFVVETWFQMKLIE